MSYRDGWAAITLQPNQRVPRTEYSAHVYHWPLISQVIGRHVDAASSEDKREQATQDFVRAWNYDFVWAVQIHRSYLGDFHTDMGHAVYASDGADKVKPERSPFEAPEQALAFDPCSMLPSYTQERLIADMDNQYQRNCRRFPDAVNMTGIYISLISGLIELFGWDLLLTAAGIDGDAFGAVAGRYTDWAFQFFTAAALSKSPVIMVHDDIVWSSGPFISPKWYREYVFPNYRRLLEPLKKSGKIIVYTSDGDFSEFIDDIAGTGVSGFVIEPMTDIAYIAKTYGKTHFFVGNADTRVLLDGDQAAIREEVERCTEIGKPHPGFFLAVGNHIPANTPVEAALYYNRCYESLMIR